MAPGATAVPACAFSWSAPGSRVSVPLGRSDSAGSPRIVVERESAWSQSGTGIYLPGNTARALRALGLESAVIERAALIPHQRICDHRGNLLTDIDVVTMWRDVGPCVALHRADLHEVLAFHGDPVPVRLGVSPRTFRQQNGTCDCRVRRRQHQPLRPSGRRRWDPFPSPPARRRSRRGPAGRATRLALRHQMPA